MQIWGETKSKEAAGSRHIGPGKKASVIGEIGGKVAGFTEWSGGGRM